MEAVVARDFLSPYLTAAFKFYIHKVLLYFLTREALQAYKASEDRSPKLFSQLTDL